MLLYVYTVLTHDDTFQNYTMFHLIIDKNLYKNYKTLKIYLF